MKRILDRFDNSPLWIRLVTVLSLSFILVAGLYTVKKNTAAQVTTEIQPAKKTGSLPVKKETKEEKEKKEKAASLSLVCHKAADRADACCAGRFWILLFWRICGSDTADAP